MIATLMRLMALLFELVTSVVGLALKPFLLAKLSCQFGVRSISVVIQTWLELLRFVLSLHFIVIWRLAIWTVAILSIPARAFTALYRERLLEIQLHRLKNEIENILWDRKELEEQIHGVTKERRVMEMMLMELEEEHDEAVVKIELLEGKVQELKDEIQQLKAVQGKALWSCWDQDDVGNGCNNMGTDNVSKSYWRPYYNKNIRQVNKDLCKDEIHNVLKAGSRIYGFSQLDVTDMILDEGNTLAKQRKIALYRSLFSAVLSLIVSIVVLEAEDPCMPLVVALFTVVTVSLMSVLQLFGRIDHRPAMEAVALLSINWFILGTVAYPMLARIARLLAPLALNFLGRTHE